MYLFDSNILRHFAEGHPNLRLHLNRVAWTEIALPSVVLAEILKGRCDYALKAEPMQATYAHQQLIETMQMLQQFRVIVFDDKCADHIRQLQRKIQTKKRCADVMIAAMASSGNHIVVTRNQSHFEDLLPARQIVNWIDQLPR